ncbi:MAG: hypothetical protein A3C85_03330 [Candidatus Doudnabacteria bacterium RIFCSPHIGHO2_02_FULL_48_21]|uniref:Helix-turn-helix domain-containing protein n=1 Tax=Candidatus Doudnabacteria bacterium RIFCSPLOWO2_02_FULL_48_13 TaxID=1817845 RepID=A0A1F5QB29_9BACT|nr:MAG: hypothetical protein A3K05_03790 [Candidatus Doudnabacteria bacterium RIFCSPHIGHO2_01_48_18]OGE77218.1 MAG: hypothetical protein A2668_01830 [Candidatus Doudnabacteria bacterium RIFCSPHIGHO2_01_FULL_48_180]OGE91428.1 MAG: hypothetical protein A3F44_00730 [Candidatus Doudnabacteria bacterium RIFCSPHIGHO2_12_FULL_47_25]OGE93276.1 MAG: hypothetical protein A3C85_03330 [Candidatus Doudnabacteria bacterium RIFCSPHIGHO2_02_FULL_48_21]OGE96807.1 MAG: hypothetical protein A3A83_02065 [Candidatu
MREKIYSTRELAKFFAVSEKTIWEWCKKGRLPGFKIGKEWKVRVSDLNRLITGKVQTKKQKGETLF